MAVNEMAQDRTAPLLPPAPPVQGYRRNSAPAPTPRGAPRVRVDAHAQRAPHQCALPWVKSHVVGPPHEAGGEGPDTRYWAPPYSGVRGAGRRAIERDGSGRCTREAKARKAEVQPPADANGVETGRVPCGALRIKLWWEGDVDLDSWLPHHYDLVRSAQRNQGFDPTSTAVAEALSLPLLQIPDPEALEGYGEESAVLEPDWSGPHELDPHTMEAAPVQLDLEATCDAN
ncbi:hypothetical protein FB451DRAFT_1494956 [Mycena latifolia]|nr:hypothetical protein FB451DRAFT_1494956 [Mycena latifolia]